MKPKCLSFHAVPAFLFLALASPGFANDDMSIFSGVTPISEQQWMGGLGLDAALPDQQPGLERQLLDGICRQRQLSGLVRRA